VAEAGPGDPLHRVALEWSPLIGGPSWLPLHVKLSIEAGDGTRHQLDFVPTDAANPEVTGRLMALQCVPGEVRYTLCGKNLNSTNEMRQPYDDRIVFRSDDETKRRWPSRRMGSIRELFSSSSAATPVVDRAVRFAASYPDRNLHLLTNNCWTFAVRLYLHLVSPD
jgi:hypothetical protein